MTSPAAFSYCYRVLYNSAAATAETAKATPLSHQDQNHHHHHHHISIIHERPTLEYNHPHNHSSHPTLPLGLSPWRFHHSIGLNALFCVWLSAKYCLPHFSAPLNVVFLRNKWKCHSGSAWRVFVIARQVEKNGNRSGVGCG